MPRRSATRRASSTASLPQHEPNRDSAPSPRPQTRMVMPTASCPASTRRAAAIDESTPPLIPTTMRCGLTPSVSRDEQDREALELLAGRVRDLDATLALAADDPHPRHQGALQRVFERGELRRAAALLGPRRGTGRRGGPRVLPRAHAPVVGEDLVAEL